MDAQKQVREPKGSHAPSPAAQRALAEAAARRANVREDKSSREVGGRKGPDPIRYGDWEVNGIASDF